MASAPTIARILELAPTSCMLAENQRFKKAMFNATPKSSDHQGTLIYIYWKILNTIYELDNAYPGLEAPARYLYELEMKYAFRAARIVDGGGGGTVAPVTPSGTGSNINDLDWLVSGSSSQLAPLANGDFAVTFDGTGGMLDLRGFNINFFRGGVTQNTTPLGDGSSYYYWNKITGLFQLLGAAPANGAAQEGELMRISPDLLNTGNVSFSLTQPVLLSLDADGTYTLPDGYFIYKINIKPTSADTVRIGTTLNGEEIMMDKLMTANVYGSNGVTADVFADGSDQTIYFTGFTTTAQISIYIQPIE
jgi:hypothetical protein